MTRSDDLTIVGFIDESCKPVRDRATGKITGNRRHYVAAAAVTLAGDLEPLRRHLVDVEARLGVPLHYGDLTAARRIAALRSIAEIDGWDGHLFETAAPFGHGTSEHHVRAKLIKAALTRLHHDDGATTIVLETRGHSRAGFEHLNQKDHDVLRRLQRHHRVDATLRIRHDTKAEPILALADLIAGARTDDLCAVTGEPYAHITHRIGHIHRIEVA